MSEHEALLVVLAMGVLTALWIVFAIWQQSRGYKRGYIKGWASAIRHEREKP